MTRKSLRPGLTSLLLLSVMGWGTPGASQPPGGPFEAPGVKSARRVDQGRGDPRPYLERRAASRGNLEQPRFGQRLSRSLPVILVGFSNVPNRFPPEAYKQ